MVVYMYMAFGSNGLRPQDIVLLVKLLILDSEDWRMVDVAKSLHLSQGEVSKSLARLREAKLVHPYKKKPLRANCLEFLLHGFKYVFPVTPGSLVTGIPTSHSASPISKSIVSDEHYVWRCSEGEMRGESIEPLYPDVPYAALADRELYEILVLLDALRVGRAREKNIASDALQKRIMG